MKKLIGAVYTKSNSGHFLSHYNATAKLLKKEAKTIMARYYKGLSDGDNMVIVYEKTDTGNIAEDR